MDAADPVERLAQNRRLAALLVGAPAAAVAAVAGIAAFVVFVVLGLPLLAVVTLVAAGGAGVALARRDRASLTERVLATLPGAPAGLEHSRLHNVIEGLCLANGIELPEVRVLDTPARNAAVVGDRPAAVLITTGLLDAVNRIELEGVVAHCLVRLRSGEALAATAVADLGRRGGLGAAAAERVLGRARREATDPELVAGADLEAARLTRYPPGLARALEKVASGETAIAGLPPASGHLWLASPGADDPTDGGDEAATHPPLAERLEVLREL